MKVTINDLIEIEKKVKEASEQLDVITVNPEYVLVLSTNFDKLFGGFAYTIRELNTKVDRFEKEVMLDGVRFVCIKGVEDLTDDERERLGLEDNF